MVYVQEFFTKIGEIQIYCHYYYNTYTMHSSILQYYIIRINVGVLNSIDLTSGRCTAAGSKILFIQRIVNEILNASTCLY